MMFYFYLFHVRNIILPNWNGIFKFHLYIMVTSFNEEDFFRLAVMTHMRKIGFTKNNIVQLQLQTVNISTLNKYLISHYNNEQQCYQASKNETYD